MHLRHTQQPTRALSEAHLIVLPQFQIQWLLLLLLLLLLRQEPRAEESQLDRVVLIMAQFVVPFGVLMLMKLLHLVGSDAQAVIVGQAHSQLAWVAP